MGFGLDGRGMNDTEDMLLSQAFEDAEPRGSLRLQLPRAPAGGACVVFASVFNFLGQRSDPTHLATGA